MSVTTHIMGGMGNQMFQYAAGLSQARWRGTDLKICTGGYKSDWRVYSLGLWAGVTEPTTESWIAPVVKEISLPYNPSLFENLPTDFTMYGYWQTEKYFMNVADELRAKFTPRLPLTERGETMKRLILSEEDRSVFLTIRRTDYLNSSYHGVLPLSYYEAALDVIKAKIPDPHVFVFSDDPEWCMDNLRLPCRTTVAGNFDRTVKPHLGREDEELVLMSLCWHAIMANSSYSWWGAWLRPFEAQVNRIVVGPKQWFGTAPNNAKDIIPERWIKL